MDMNKPKNPPADKQQKFEDHSVIVPAHSLKNVVRRTAEPGEIDMGVVERAEAALASLKGEFSGWMNTECERLEEARKALHQNGQNAATLEILFRTAHDIKGDAATLGYPLAGTIASSLGRLIYHWPKGSSLPMHIVDKAVEAIRAVVRENVRHPQEPTGSEVSEKLAILVEQYLARELKDGYAEIAADAAPSLKLPEKP
jgi:chemotaxis protein histidine kinase CheA